MSTKTDFVIYDNEFHSGITEVLEQAALDLNDGASGTLRLVTQSLLGDFDKETFFDLVDNLVQERDPTSTADVPASGLAQSEHVAPKVNRRVGPHEDTLDKFKKIDKDPAVMSFIVGQQAAKGVMLDYLNTGLIALTAAIKSQPEVVYNVVADADATVKTAKPAYLNKAISKFGDAGSRIRSWVMHSAPYYELVGDAIAEKVTGVSDLVVYGGLPGTLGKPVYMSDSPALVDLDPTGDGLSPAEYTILGLTENALVLTQSEATSVISETIGGKANIVARWQAEHAFNVKVKGFSYTGTGSSPTKAQLGTSANWTQIVTDIKSTAGVALIVN